VCAYTSGQTLDRDAVLDKECDIWIPAAHLSRGARAPFGSFAAEGQVFFLTHR